MTDRLTALAETETRRCAAMLAGDLATLDALIDPDLHFSHATGAIDDKAAYMAKLTAGRIDYLAIDWSEQDLVDLGGAGLVTGRMTSRVRVEGVEKTLDNRVLAVWTPAGAGWRLRAFQSTPLVAARA